MCVGKWSEHPPRHTGRQGARQGRRSNGYPTATGNAPNNNQTEWARANKNNKNWKAGVPNPAQVEADIPEKKETHQHVLKKEQQETHVQEAKAAEPDLKTVLQDRVEDAMIRGVAETISRMADMNTQPDRDVRTRFHSLVPPNMPVKDYFERLRTWFNCSGECYVLCIVYIDRLLKRSSWLKLNGLTAHRLLLTSLVLAAKQHDDVFFSNAFYAKVGGLPVKELNILESDLLKLLDWSLFVSPSEYTAYKELVEKASANVKPRTRAA